jgi:hypothetical protein
LGKHNSIVVDVERKKKRGSRGFYIPNSEKRARRILHTLVVIVFQSEKIQQKAFHIRWKGRSFDSSKARQRTPFMKWNVAFRSRMKCRPQSHADVEYSFWKKENLFVG